MERACESGPGGVDVNLEVCEGSVERDFCLEALSDCNASTAASSFTAWMLGDVGEELPRLDDSFVYPSDGSKRLEAGGDRDEESTDASSAGAAARDLLLDDAACWASCCRQSAESRKICDSRTETTENSVEEADEELEAVRDMLCVGVEGAGTSVDGVYVADALRKVDGLAGSFR